MPLSAQSRRSTLRQRIGSPTAPRNTLVRLACLSLSALLTWTVALAPPLQAWAQQPGHPAQKPAPIPPKPHDDPAWHTINYHAVPVSDHPQAPNVRPKTLTLLDEVGRLERPVTTAQAQAWRQELNHRPLANARAAKLHLWLGEYLLAHDQEPEQAIAQFDKAAQLGRPSDHEYNLPAYDIATALYYEGAYQESADAFGRLLTNRHHRGFDTRTCALWLRHAQACAGYHAERVKAGITEPVRLDPLCGVAALAACLRSMGLPYDKKRILSVCHVTGEGNNLQDLLQGARKLGLSVRAITADDAGLKALNTCLISYVEHDHFICVTGADSKGVSYLCSDCGPFPGGARHLTWAQWHKMDASLYGAVCKPGSALDRKLSDLAVAGKGASARKIELASSGPLSKLHLGVLAWRPSGLKGHITLYDPLLQNVTCGSKPEAQHCHRCYTPCPDQQPASGSPYAATSGDPVNLSTGEEEYTPGSDITVYNPIGPSVIWSRLYNSMRGPTSWAYQNSDFGVGWSQQYNIAVYDTSPIGGVSPQSLNQQARPAATGGGGNGTKYLILPNGARFTITAPSIPTAANPTVSCTVPTGYPYLVTWNYDTAHSSTYFTITLADRTKWITTDTTTAPGFAWYPLGKIVDRNGNAIQFSYTSPASGFPLLTSIADTNNVTLLTINRAANGNILSVADRYGRSVYYNVGSYLNTNGRYWAELDHVSQIVATGTASPPNRYVYGYTNVIIGDPNNPTEAMPFLSSTTVPSPTGTGTVTASINYQPSTCYVTSIVDGNGNKTSFSSVDQSHTKVSIANAQGTVAFSYTVGFDLNMNCTTYTDGSNQTIVYSATYSDPHAPAQPSQIQDGNGYASGGANGKGTWKYTWDQYSNLVTATTPYNTTTTFTYNYTNFAMGEKTEVQQGSKSPTMLTYYEPSGLIKSVTCPLPGTAGGTQTVTSSATYDNLGNLLTLTAPGNNAATSIVTTYNYTTDGSYTQSAAISQPLTITNNLGKVTHLRYYNSQINVNDPPANTGQAKSMTDPLGNTYTFNYNIARQPVSFILPATGQSGTQNSSIVNTFLYPGGPRTVVSAYNEANTQVQQINTTYGLEGETLSVSGSTEPVTKTYDALYRMISLADGNNHTTYWTFGATGYLNQVTYPDVNGTYDTVQYTSRDANGNALTRVDGRGITTTYLYQDPQSQLTDIQYPATPGLNIHNAYDGYGRIETATDGTGSRTFDYDDLDNWTSVQTSYTGLPAQTISYGYYANGSRASLNITGLATGFSYSYDADGRLTGLSNPYGEAFSWTYLDNNWLWTKTLSTAATVTYTYNALGRVTDLANRTVNGNTLLSEFGGANGSGNAMVYDGIGNRVSELANVPAVATYSGLTQYQFDTKSQLTQESSARSGGYTNGFGYDSAGNATTFRNVANIGYNSDNQFSNAAQFQYDGNGNPTTYNTIACTFDPENRMTGYGAIFSAGYNGGGQRAWKQNAAGKTYYLYDGTTPICEMDVNGNITAVNTFGVGGLLARHSGGSSIFYTFDPQGNPVQRLNSSGGVLGSYMFDGFGKRGSTDNSTDPFSGFGSQWGYYSDWETGLQLLGWRYYDSGAGRFVNRDSLSYDGGINLYGYVRNSPLCLADPSGASPVITEPIEGPPSGVEPFPIEPPAGLEPILPPEFPPVGPGLGPIAGPVLGIGIGIGVGVGIDIMFPGNPLNQLGNGLGQWLFPPGGELPADPLPPCNTVQPFPVDPHKEGDDRHHGCESFCFEEAAQKTGGPGSPGFNEAFQACYRRCMAAPKN
jgi:RHS repeat-associated protein